MVYFRFLFFFFFLTISLNAQMLKDIVYVEDLNSSQIMLKDEFTKQNTDSYTLVVSKLKVNEDDPIEFFRKYKLTNAIGYRYGQNREFIRVLSGVYPNYIEAKEAIENLPKELLKFKPYHSKISHHQKLYKKDNNIKTIEKKTTPIFSSGIVTKNEKLKEQFLDKSPKYYSISLASFDFTNKKEIEDFFEKQGISKEALAHLYGKNKNRVRVVFGLYNSFDEAKKGIETLSKDLKANSPFVQKIKTMQNFYKKYNSVDDTPVVKFDVKKNDNEKTNVIQPKIEEEIKIVRKIEPPVTKRVIEKTLPKKEVKPKQKVEVTKKKIIEKKQTPIKSKFLKESKNEDIYYIEPDGSFNILNEVFLNEQSSFYTIDLGEIKIEEMPLDKLFIQYNLKNNTLAYKYGDKKELARVVYGAFETKNDAKEKLEQLNTLGFNSSMKVSNIQEHQKLYNQYHENIVKETKKVEEGKEIKEYNSDSDFVYVGESNSLKEAFLNKDESIYTITLITFQKDDINLKEFLERNGLDKDVIAYSLGSQNNYYRVFYGAFKSSKETLEVIDKLDFELKKNKPYVSKVVTNLSRFESYNNRDMLKAIKNAEIIK